MIPLPPCILGCPKRWALNNPSVVSIGFKARVGQIFHFRARNLE